MTPCVRPTRPCQAAPTPVSGSNVWLDVEVLAERYEDLLALSRDESSESEPQEADELEEEASDDLPF